jgi:pimeloyl-ACP methyl ester carboxylesterase
MASEGNVPVKTVRVSHLNGTSIGYQLPKTVVGSKNTLILIPPFGTPSLIFKPQLTNPELLASFNLLVLEPLGQGVTKTNSPVWTAWDSAYAFIQAMDSLGVKKAFVLGESQGGWIAARMALYAPDRVSVCCIFTYQYCGTVFEDNHTPMIGETTSWLTEYFTTRSKASYQSAPQWTVMVNAYSTLDA